MSSLDAIKHAVESGLGVAILPRRCAAAEIAAGRLIALELPHLAMRRELRLAYSGRRDLVARRRGLPGRSQGRIGPAFIPHSPRP